MNRDSRIDAYIEKSADFAKAILTHIRAAVHEGCPDVVETMKWGTPSFEYQGPMCGMAAFKEHCRVSFWKGGLLTGASLEPFGDSGMAGFPHLTSVKELPARATLVKLVKQAARLNQDGVKAPAPKRAPRPDVDVPDDFMAALKKNRQALTAFERFPPSHRREYVQWISDAKREETRQRRLETAIAQIAEGKPQNWKYMK